MRVKQGPYRRTEEIGNVKLERITRSRWMKFKNNLEVLNRERILFSKRKDIRTSAIRLRPTYLKIGSAVIKKKKMIKEGIY